MNLLPASLTDEGPGVGLQFGSQRLGLPPARTSGLVRRHGAVTFGLRPEHIGAEPRPQGDSVPVPGLLRFLEHMGNEVYVHAEIGGLPLTARVAADQLGGLDGAARGTPHTFHLQLQRCHLFDAETGANLLT
jgi:oligogalacturonide transport system ATP-binding protein